jgi:hypothetical protein
VKVEAKSAEELLVVTVVTAAGLPNTLALGQAGSATSLEARTRRVTMTMKVATAVVATVSQTAALQRMPVDPGAR